MADVYVLDTSAIFAFTDHEKGADDVEKLLEAARDNKCRLEICAISLMEVYYVALMEQGDDEATRLIGLMKSWRINWVYPDEKTLLQAGKLKARFRLSLADAIIAAVAKLHNASLVHKDPELAALSDEVTLFALPYKKKIE